ncbi:hypothetical protein LNV47_19230 [Paucibacter sp. DJ4R-1]|nr:hypothetical protein [Paucibacter sp. DJ4R-1]
MHTKMGKTMTAFLDQYDAHRCSAEGDLLSREPDKRIVELQFLQRLLSTPAQLEPVFHFCRPVAAVSTDYVAADFARMTDPDGNALLTTFEDYVPARGDFGPFRSRRK